MNATTPDRIIDETDDTQLVCVTASDGSKLYNVLVDIGSHEITIAGNDLSHARRIFAAIEDASWIEVTEADAEPRNPDLEVARRPTVGTLDEVAGRALEDPKQGGRS